MKENSFKRLIVVAWVVLILCLVIKLFGGNWFELSTENTKFIEFCNWVDSITIVKMILASLICVTTTYPVYCIMLNKRKIETKWKIILITLTIIKSIISWYNTTISFCLDVFILLGLMTFINKKFLRNLVCFVGVSVLQIITILLRNISFDFNLGNTFIEQTLYQVDYYLMIVLSYLYNFKNRRKEV